MRYRERAQSIADALATLPDAGHVHARSRATTDWAKYQELLRVAGTGGAKDRICGWTVSRKGAKLGESSANWVELYTLLRVCGVDDQGESEFAFQESLDAAAAYFRENPTLSWGTVTGELVLGVIEERILTGLVHVAECDLAVAMDFDELSGGET